MSRILVLGVGVPSCVPWEQHAGPGLRAAHFATALAEAGHELLLVAVLAEGDAVPPRPSGLPFDVEFVREKRLLTPEMRRRIDAFAPDGIVAATAYAASLAVRLRSEAPLWADVFGDLMAEAQAKAARSGSDWSIVHFWTLLRGVLERADRFSAVSVAQSHALVGQLGIAGRLSARTAGEALVATIPCAAAPLAGRIARDEARLRFGIANDDFVLLLSGGVNTWCDVDTLVEGLALAMREEPRLRLLVTGGPIPGHDERSHARLLDGLSKLDPSRVRHLGWIASAQLLPLYAASDLALHVEVPLYERELGAENRVVEWLAQGLACLTTALSETGRELVAGGRAFGCRSGDAADLAKAIVRLAGSPALLRETAERGRQWASSERGYARTAAPLLEWCEAPCAARDRDGARLVEIGLVSHPETSIEMLDAYVAALPVRELARRGLRWIARRIASSFSGIARRVLRPMSASRRRAPAEAGEAAGRRGSGRP